MQIAIDGPSGAGKSSVAKAIAKELGIVYVDTGALYRTVGYYVRSKGVARDDKAGIVRCLPDIRIEVCYENGAQYVYLNGEDLGDRIREPEISMYASAVSAVPAVRDFLLDIQRDIAAKNDVIMDGRDIGTVILPRADVKVFLTASLEARAMRRTAELLGKGIEARFEDVLRAVLVAHLDADSGQTTHDALSVVTRHAFGAHVVTYGAVKRARIDVYDAEFFGDGFGNAAFPRAARPVDGNLHGNSSPTLISVLNR